MDKQPISEIMSETMTKLKEMIDVNTIVGDPVTTPDGMVIIPVSKVVLGFASGGTDFNSRSQAENAAKNFGGGAGAGVTITPVAFLVAGNGHVRLLPVKAESSAAEKAIDLAPELIDKVKGIFCKSKDAASEE